MSKSRSNEDKDKDKERDSAEKEKEKENANDAFPDSPPPSYEHVIERIRGLETRLKTYEQHQPVAKGPEILHKSSKEFYRAVAKQRGITCKMSDQCRCLDCQSRYFDCEYEKNEHEKTDGGLGAGTPMFISEVMESSGCVLL